MNTEHGRRYRIYRLTELMLSLLMREEATIRCMCGVPPDAQYLGGSYNFAARAFEVAFEHPSFDLVPDGEEAPQAIVALEVVSHPWEGKRTFPHELGTGPLPLNDYLKVN